MDKKSSLKVFQKDITSLRTTTEYTEALNEISEHLGLPRDLEILELYVLIIKATKDKYADGIEADAALCAVGLLEGYGQRERASFEKSEQALITARRKKFLAESSYVATKYRKENKKAKYHFSSYEEALTASIDPSTGKFPADTVLSTLGSDDGRFLEKIAELIYCKRDIFEYLEQAKKEYGVVNNYGDIVDVKYPKLVNVRQDADAAPSKMDEPAAKNTDIAAELTSIDTTASVEMQGDFADEVDTEISPQLRKKEIDSKSILSVLSALVAVLSLVSLVVIWSAYPKQETVINQVSIVEDSVTLESGRFATLQIDYVPEDADPGILDCSEGYDDRLLFAIIDKLWTNSSGSHPALTVGAREPWGGNFPYNAAVKVKADDNVCDYVDVTVIEKTPIDLGGNNTDDGVGEKTDVAP